MDPITITLTPNQYESLVAALNWVLDDAGNDTRIQEELEECLRVLDTAKLAV